MRRMVIIDIYFNKNYILLLLLNKIYDYFNIHKIPGIVCFDYDYTPIESKGEKYKKIHDNITYQNNSTGSLSIKENLFINDYVQGLGDKELETTIKNLQNEL